VNFPGPPGSVLVLALLALASASVIVGEAVRLVARRWVATWRELEAVERLLLDFFLGGAVLYALAALPVGGFSAPVVEGIVGAAAVGVAVVAVRGRRAGRFSGPTLVGPILRPGALVALSAGLLLLVFEVAIALPVGTGNTFDSSLLTFYTGRLLSTHELALSFRPSSPVGLLYPQGATAWLGTAQLLLGLPGARSSLLLTPLFFGWAPVGGFALGRRLFGGDAGGAALAVGLAALASWTRVLVGGSNDFVFAFPLVLWLAGQSVTWSRTVPSPADAVGFGLVLGYSAALNPVGAEWLAPALLVMGALQSPRFAGRPGRWLSRWATAVGAAGLGLLPTWAVLAQGLASPGYVPAVASAAVRRPGISAPQLLGLVDPYLFGSRDVWLSPLPVLRAELAILLTAGLVLLVAVGRWAFGPRLATVASFVTGGVLSAFVLLGLVWAGSRGGPLGGFAEVISPAEVSIWLFTVYAVVAMIPLALAGEHVARTFKAARRCTSETARAAVAKARSAPPRWRAERSAVLALVLSVAVVAPGAVLTPVELPAPLTTIYDDFGNVTGSDFALLEYAGAHLPGGARVLVAPGSAGEFLPAYAPGAVLLYPMFPGALRSNASYALLVTELTNATLTPAGIGALHALGVQFVIVTQRNSQLWSAFSPEPLELASFPVVFAEGDAYLFNVTGGGTTADTAAAP
jgi:hypothetical protein